MRRAQGRRLLAVAAVLAALGAPRTLAQDDRPTRRVKDPALQAGINAAIEKGIAYLKTIQREDGSWVYDAKTRRGGPRDATGGLTALVLYALAASGVPAGDVAIGAGLRWASKHEAPYRAGAAYGTYSASLLILALTRIDARRHKRRIVRLAERLVESQRDNDMWTYKLEEKRTSAREERPPGRGPRRPSAAGDNSNSQYAVLALWAAEALAGCKVPRKTWLRIQDFYGRTQGGDGTWGYRPATRGRATMTAAGLVSYVYATAALMGGVEALPMARRDPIARRGLRAFVRQRAPDWSNYYLVYSIERVGTVLARPGKDWYTEGARVLVGAQQDDGSWQGDRHGDRKHAYETALALLFLSRATVHSITPGGH